MDESQFWAIIATACEPDPRRAEDWDEQLQAELVKLTPDEIIAWNHIFYRLAAQAYTTELWGAAYLINGGASDDGFYYYRCWLICMGQAVYEAALANPDGLADVFPSLRDKDRSGICAETETYAAAHKAWLAVTGNSYFDPYPARNEKATLRGEDWHFEDQDENRRRLPRLAALYYDESD